MTGHADSEVLEQTKIKVKKPTMWTVVFHNDDFTPMDFVVFVLEEIMRLETEEAEAVMLAIHNNGKERVGRFTQDIAATKQIYITETAITNGHPLKVTIEPLPEE